MNEVISLLTLNPAPMPVMAPMFVWKKMKHLISAAALALPLLTLGGCADGRMDAARMLAIDVVNHEADYRQEARRFVRLAQAGDLNGMLRLTSSQTVAAHGKQALLENYKNKLIPAFHNSRIEWSSTAKVIYELDYNPGLEFSGVVHGSTTTPFYLSLFKENGKIVLVNARRTPKPTKNKD